MARISKLQQQDKLQEKVRVLPNPNRKKTKKVDLDPEINQIVDHKNEVLLNQERTANNLHKSQQSQKNKSRKQSNHKRKSSNFQKVLQMLISIQFHQNKEK